MASEVVNLGITFTTIHMPLVRTPMIAPTKIYDAFPTITPEEAGGMICDALRAKPKEINTRLGTFGSVTEGDRTEGGRSGAAHGLPGVPGIDCGQREISH